MLRSGSAENLLAHLARSDILHLRNIQTGGEWGGGVRPPSNMTTYAYYLDTRIKSFRDLRHDLVFSQTESNRRSTGLGANSKARRLRHLPVEKGLLREVKQVQRILDALIRCTFYDDDLRDENTVLAYRLLIKDLLVLFQAGNEGVCNILEHYFEMSKIDATDAFEIYKSFIKQTDKIVDYLAIARRLNNIVNVPVPTLKHAPTSLVKALEEYLNDPNFEQNRQEYKKSLGVVEGKNVKSSPSPKPKSKDEGRKDASSSSADAAPAPVAATQQKIQDFLDSIETEQEKLHSLQQNAAQQQQAHAQQMMQFGGMSGGMGPAGGVGSIGSMGSMNSMATAQLHPQMTGANPFRQSVMFPQQTGMPLSGFPQQQQGMGMQPQATGFPMQQQQQMQPQATGFLQPQKTGQMAFGHQQQPFMQAQPTGFLQPQATGSNPFRQSMMPSSGSKGNLAGQAQPFGSNSAFGSGSGSFSQPSSASPFSPSTINTSAFGSGPNSAFGQASQPNSASAFAPGQAFTQGPQTSSPQPTSPKPLTAQKTGSNNPFAPPGGVPAPQAPVPKMPNLNELAQQKYQQQFAQAGGLNPTPAQPSSQPQPQRQQSASSPWDPLGPSSNGGTGMSDIASAFAIDKPQQSQQSGQNKDLLSSFGDLNFGSSPPSSNNTSEFLQPQKTGFGGSTVKPFQPTSSFGKSLMESLPPIAEPSASPSGLQAQSTGFPFSHGGQFTSSPAASPGLVSPGAAPNGTPGANGANGANGASSPGGNSPFGQNHSNSFGAFTPPPPPQPQLSHSTSFGAFPPRANSVSTASKSFTGAPSPFAPQRSATTDPTFTAPLQAQTTGSNPFRQSLMPSMTGGSVGAGVGGGGAFGGNSPFAQTTGTGGNSGAFGSPSVPGVQNGVMAHPTGIAAFGAQQFATQGQWGQSFARPN